MNALQSKTLTWLAPLVLLTCALAGCGRKEGALPAAITPAPAPVAAPSQLKPVAGVQDIMAFMVDPAADFLWESVSTTVSRQGAVERQPHTDAEWSEVHRQAIILTEASNLLLMDGRRVAREGKSLEDHGTPGNLTAEESQKTVDANRATFEGFARSLREVGMAMLAAAESKNPQAIIDAGDTMDQVCEGCHLKFWYPGQKIPPFPDEAPEVDQQ